MPNRMDFLFPQQLFPSFYNCGPPDTVMGHCVGNWGCYDRVRLQSNSGPPSSWTFTSRHQVRGETWRHTEPVPVPLLSPKRFLPAVVWPSTPPDPFDFIEHMRNFYVDHCQDNFGCMSALLKENFHFERGRKDADDSVHVWQVKNSLDMLNLKICPDAYSSGTLDAYANMLSDVVHAVPPELLGPLLYEELKAQRERMLFSEGATGGALAYVPPSQSGSSSQQGYLIYPGNQGLDCLNFHPVELQHRSGCSPCVDATSSDPFSFQLKGSVRQISAVSLFNDCCVGVRSDHFCGVWRSSESSKPRLLQVVSTRGVATCISVSPHVLGEVLVASESGAAHLWTVGRGMQSVREEDSNLYFNAKSPWRWCEFSAHPRVMLYADRTGVELTDIRVNPAVSHTLFRINNMAECQSGERLILSRYLGDAHSFHHLITTQCSAYIVDERFPGVPMLKWDHMMQSPPLFCHVIPGDGSAGGGARTTKVLLGSHSCQEITLLQYSGGRAEACFSKGPPQALLRPRDSLDQLPVQIPHRLDTASSRLSSPAAGLTCIHQKGGRDAVGEECICILQLTEAGDIFYQILEPEQPDTSQPPAAETEPLPQQEANRQPQPPHEETPLVASDTSDDEGVVAPSQEPTAVAETPERSSSEESECMKSQRGRNLKRLWLKVVVNDDPEPDPADESDAGVRDGKLGEDNAEEADSGSGGLNNVGPTTSQTSVKLSSSALVTWRRWLQKLMQKSRENKGRPHCLRHLRIRSGGLLQLPHSDARDPTEEERVHRLQRDLRACMSKRSLVVHGAVSLEPPEVVHLPNPVDTEIWTDELSHRLTVSWQGEEAWRAWWDDRLGLNRDDLVAALRRKRRLEKRARRAGGQRLDLARSFTSSLSYQSELDDFSDSAGWSSATSQQVCSDSESAASQWGGSSWDRRPRAATPSSVQTDSPVRTPAAPPESVEEQQGDQQIPSSIPSLPQTPRADAAANQRRSKRAVDDYLSSLFAQQDEPSQHDGYFLDEGISDLPAAASSSQLRSSQSVPQRSLRVDLSQDASALSGFSQSLPPSQRSQGRQASQPKKKSRMGF